MALLPGEDDFYFFLPLDLISHWCYLQKERKTYMNLADRRIKKISFSVFVVEENVCQKVGMEVDVNRHLFHH